MEALLLLLDIGAMVLMVFWSVRQEKAARLRGDRLPGWPAPPPPPPPR